MVVEGRELLFFACFCPSLPSQTHYMALLLARLDHEAHEELLYVLSNGRSFNSSSSKWFSQSSDRARSQRSLAMNGTHQPDFLVPKPANRGRRTPFAVCPCGGAKAKWMPLDMERPESIGGIDSAGNFRGLQRLIPTDPRFDPDRNPKASEGFGMEQPWKQRISFILHRPFVLFDRGCHGCHGPSLLRSVADPFGPSGFRSRDRPSPVECSNWKCPGPGD